MMESMRPVLRYAAPLLFIALAPLNAQLAGRTSKVRAVVDSFFTAAEHEQWDVAAALMDTVKFGAYVRQQVRYARSAVPMRPTTAEELMARDSTMPRAVAEWEVQQSQKLSAMRGPFSMITYEFLGVITPQQLSELTATQALARWIAAKDPRVRMRESARRSGCPDTVVNQIPLEKSAIHGIAFDGDTTAYVIVMNDPPIPMGDGIGGRERVFALHPRGAAWRIEPRRELFMPAVVGISTSCDHK